MRSFLIRDILSGAGAGGPNSAPAQGASGQANHQASVALDQAAIAQSLAATQARFLAKWAEHQQQIQANKYLEQLRQQINNHSNHLQPQSQHFHHPHPSQRIQQQRERDDVEPRQEEEDDDDEEGPKGDPDVNNDADDQDDEADEESSEIEIDVDDDEDEVDPASRNRARTKLHQRSSIPSGVLNCIGRGIGESSGRNKTSSNDDELIDVNCLSDAELAGSANSQATIKTELSAHSRQSLAATGKQLSADTFQLNSPLDALFQMTSSTFDALKRGEKRKDRESDGQHGSSNFTGKQASKKKRKSRTAFTNNQIYELERRFRIQKYLSPTDRDEIAMTLNLSNAQVITWFQNRRAKMKRDLEEQKRDIETASLLNLHKTFLESFQALSQMKTATSCGLPKEDQET